MLAACIRAVAIQAFTYHSIHSILKKGLDRQPLLDRVDERTHPDHDNLRGSTYYR